MMGLDTRIDVPLKGTSTSCNQIGIPNGSLQTFLLFVSGPEAPPVIPFGFV